MWYLENWLGGVQQLTANQNRDGARQVQDVSVRGY